MANSRNLLDGKEDLLAHLTLGFEALMNKVDELVTKNVLLEQQMREYQSLVSIHDKHPPRSNCPHEDTFLALDLEFFAAVTDNIPNF